MKIIDDAFTHPDSAIRWIIICVFFMFDGFRWLSLYSTRERKNNSESARAEFDLCSHHQSISMAGLNLLSPKLKQTVSRYHPKAADVLHCAPYRKPEAAGPPSCPNDQGQKEGLGETEPSGGSHIKWPVWCYCGNYHRKAAVHMRAEQGGNSRCVWARGNYFIWQMCFRGPQRWAKLVECSLTVQLC